MKQVSGSDIAHKGRLGVWLLALSLSLIIGCDKGANVAPTPAPTPVAPEAPSELSPVAQAQAAHERLNEASRHLRTSIESLLLQPGRERLQTARDAWRRAHVAYKSTRLYHYLALAHPEFDQSGTEPVRHPLWVRLDAYPLEPGYLDYVEGYPFSGLVFAESVPISAESLNEQHQFGDHYYVTLGFHALEFLLWGENQDQDTRRSWQDYTGAREGTPPSERALSRLRRRQFLDLVSVQLASDLHALTDAWQSSGAFYPAAWTRTPEPQRSQLLRAAVVKTLQQDVAQPLQRLLELAGRDWDAAAVESAFSHNGKADILAALAPVSDVLKTPDSATALRLEATTLQHLVAGHQKLEQALQGLADSAFAPIGARLTEDDISALRAALRLALSQLDLIMAQ